MKRQTERWDMSERVEREGGIREREMERGTEREREK